ncbi:Soluble NSF attachment protein, SNAP [Novymonas esmeraldas]|uniref:Soluble NSF attachment protein, SNAP n=1 Tax=Novymonas esmeraldas TaxID=1808958 RepID=A0AAW0EUX9_9TRYP
MQNVLSLGRQQGWGATATGAATRRLEGRGSVTVMCPDTPDTHSSLSSRPFSGGLKRGGGAPVSASAADVVAATTTPPADHTHLQPTANPSEAAATQQQQQHSNTNGVCEAIVTAALYGAAEGGIVAPSASAAAAAARSSRVAAAAAAAAVDGAEDEGRPRSASRPFGSYSTSDVSVSQQFRLGSNGAVAADPASTAAAGAGVVVVPSGSADGDTGVVAVATSPTGAEMSRLLAEARRAYAVAEARLMEDGLALCDNWMSTRDLFFAAGSLFAAVGETTTAARCLLHATFINRAFHNDSEALMTLTMAVEQLKVAHPRIAVDSLLRLAPCYASQDLRYQAARCLRDAAELLEGVLAEPAAAVVQYRAALDMYAETQSAAAATARGWQRQQDAEAEATATAATPTVDAPVVDTPPPEQITSDAVAVVAPPPPPPTTTTTATATGLAPSRKSFTDVVGGKRYYSPGITVRGPAPYRVSTSVQRSLADACRWRLTVLLTRLGRYEEVREAALGCAAAVPSTLPKTKFLLYATLCVLARGAASDVTATHTTAAAAAPTTTTTAAVAGDDVADAVYFDSLYDGERFFLALQDEDRTFQRGKENALVRAVLAANRACSLTAFDDAVRTYMEYRTTEPCIVFDLLVARCRRSLYDHVERFA